MPFRARETRANVTDLVQRARGGDQAAFRELYRQQVGRVYALCLRMARDGAEAEELTQDVFVRVWERLTSFRGESAFTTWLHRVTVNVVLEARRKRRRREARVLPMEDPAVLERPGADARPALSVDLERAIAMLPEGAREVFLLYDVEGYGHAEIAEMVGIAAGTSKAQLFRARQLLRKVLQR
jgi:RNA polymerase sigma-70 factor (ECF subfamily)